MFQKIIINMLIVFTDCGNRFSYPIGYVGVCVCLLVTVCRCMTVINCG